MARAANASSLRHGQVLDLTIEKPAAGGRMIARHEGQVVLVAGAIPGERVSARIERTEKRVAFAEAVDVRDPSPDRRPATADPLCGGCVYSHIEYARQLALKSAIVQDAFARIGRIPLDTPVAVFPSPERGYRMRARFHAAGGRVGFYREGTHTLCDPRSTGQLTSAALDAVQSAVDRVERIAPVVSVEITENIPGDQRALLIEIDDRSGSGVPRTVLSEIVAAGDLLGCGVAGAGTGRLSAGELRVADALSTLTNGRATSGDLGRHPESFFQSNRYLAPLLVESVLDAAGSGGSVLDLYAGVGLFSVSLAATGGDAITAVEGDRASGADLQTNAGPFGSAITLALTSVEDYLDRGTPRAQTVIVDPPRTGMSSHALDRIAALAAPRIVYVSCDPATMARDARMLLDSGYALEELQAFDLFPNTPHVECLGLFTGRE
ncbi:MAG TPA: TRAM domain-containing protein [Vicinamibacterales bacterium]|nr:TRAM domain-containing protein [Vicinamibacterales bacterium]